MFVVEFSCSIVFMGFVYYVVCLCSVVIVWNEVCIIWCELNSLIDCELIDIGLFCGDIECVVCNC